MSIMNGASHWCHISKSKSTLQKEWLDKACEWLEKQEGALVILKKETIAEFRKAMEE